MSSKFAHQTQSKILVHAPLVILVTIPATRGGRGAIAPQCARGFRKLFVFALGERWPS